MMRAVSIVALTAAVWVAGDAPAQAYVDLHARLIRFHEDFASNS
jgi:hypothetical protein